MPTREKPRNLQDVSHLFLSRGKSAERRGAAVEAVLWLISLGAGNNRAFISAGCAAAAAGKGVHVTLLEIGGGLPNIGYYFSLDPREYAVVSVDPSRLVTGKAGDYLQYVSCAATGPLERYEPPSCIVDAPRLLLVAFEYGIENRIVEDIGSRWMPDHGGRPDALCTFGAPGGRIERRTLLDGVRELHREAFLLDLAGDSAAERNGVADETLTVPERLVSSWFKKLPPEDPFFDDIVSTVLQVLSHRRRRMEDHAAG
jgi:hypothetical protein